MIVAVPFAALLKIWLERLVERRAKSEHVKRLPMQQRLWIEKA